MQIGWASRKLDTEIIEYVRYTRGYYMGATGGKGGEGRAPSCRAMSANVVVGVGRGQKCSIGRLKVRLMFGVLIEIYGRRAG